MLRSRGAVCVGVGARRIGAVLDHDVVLNRFRHGPGPGTEIEGFEEFARSAYADLHGYVLRQVGPNDVDDVVSAAFETAWRRWGDRPPTNDRCRAWVFGIAHMKVLELYRAYDRDRCVVDAVAAQPPGVSAATDEVVATDRVQRWLGALPVHERASVYLVAICGFTLAEVGTILGRPTSTVSARVTRALRRLRPLVDTEMASVDTEMALVDAQMEGRSRGLGR